MVDPSRVSYAEQLTLARKEKRFPNRRGKPMFQYDYKTLSSPLNDFLLSMCASALDYEEVDSWKETFQ